MLNIGNFSSLFELYCTFNLASILFEKYDTSSSENKSLSFISLITERILQKHNPIRDRFKTLISRAKIDKESVENLMKKYKSGSFKEKLDVKLTEIISVVNKTQEYQEEYNNLIEISYQPNSFSLICMFQFLYGMIILFLGGIYQSNIGLDKLNCFLLTFNILVLVSQIILFAYDTTIKEYKIKTWVKRLESKGFFKNGYIFILKLIGVIVLVSIIVTLIVPFRPIENYYIYHDFILVFTLLLPILGFVVYFIKASKRANHNIAIYENKMTAIESDFDLSTNEVTVFLEAHSLINDLESRGRISFG